MVEREPAPAGTLSRLAGGTPVGQGVLRDLRRHQSPQHRAAAYPPASGGFRCHAAGPCRWRAVPSRRMVRPATDRQRMGTTLLRRSRQRTPAPKSRTGRSATRIAAATPPDRLAARRRASRGPAAHRRAVAAPSHRRPVVPRRGRRHPGHRSERIDADRCPPQDPAGPMPTHTARKGIESNLWLFGAPDLYAVRKRQLDAKELRHHRLQNDAPRES